MPQSNRGRAGEVCGLRGMILVLSLAILQSGCGEGEARSAAVEIKSVEWRGGRVLADGEWAKGLSTPPLCRILEARDGPASNHFEPDARVSLTGNTFSKEFVPVAASQERPPDADEDLYVRCSVSLDSGRSADDVAKIGEAP